MRVPGPARGLGHDPVERREGRRVGVGVHLGRPSPRAARARFTYWRHFLRRSDHRAASSARRSITRVTLGWTSGAGRQPRPRRSSALAPSRIAAGRRPRSPGRSGRGRPRPAAPPARPAAARTAAPKAASASRSQARRERARAARRRRSRGPPAAVGGGPGRRSDRRRPRHVHQTASVQPFAALTRAQAGGLEIGRQRMGGDEARPRRRRRPVGPAPPGRPARGRSRRDPSAERLRRTSRTHRAAARRSAGPGSARGRPGRPGRGQGDLDEQDRSSRRPVRRHARGPSSRSTATPVATHRAGQRDQARSRRIAAGVERRRTADRARPGGRSTSAHDPTAIARPIPARPSVGRPGRRPGSR